MKRALDAIEGARETLTVFGDLYGARAPLKALADNLPALYAAHAASIPTTSHHGEKIDQSNAG